MNLPKFLRYPLAKLISKRRAPIAKKIYQELGGSSPILKLTNDQSNLLEKMLNHQDKKNQYKCFIVMRCWNPRASKVISDKDVIATITKPLGGFKSSEVLSVIAQPNCPKL